MKYTVIWSMTGAADEDRLVTEVDADPEDELGAFDFMLLAWEEEAVFDYDDREEGEPEPVVFAVLEGTPNFAY